MLRSRLRALLLDIDGTLVHTDALYFKVFQRLLKPFGYEVDESFYTQHIHGRVDADVFSTLMPPSYGSAELAAMSREKDRLFCEVYREEVAHNGPPMVEGLPDALSLCRTLGVRAVAVTNAPRGAAELMRSLRARQALWNHGAPQ